MSVTKTKRRRGARGFSLIEALTAGVCLIIAVLGVIFLIQQVGRSTSQADFNVQAAKLAQEMLAARTSLNYAGAQALLPMMFEEGPGTFPSGQNYRWRVEYRDTSAAGALPNLGQPSVHIRVMIWRDNEFLFLAPIGSNPNGVGRRLIVEGYVLQS